MSAKPPAIFLMGPTASGKSRLAVQIAQQIDAEIISVDSALVYRGMDIGTAKPTVRERGGIQHHLIDILDPSEAFSSGQFRSQALRLMHEISRRGRIPLLTGGTMLYFNALLHGLAELPVANDTIRKNLHEQALRHGNAYLHDRLKQVDPEAAVRIHPNDPQRVQRALEVYELSGIPLSLLQKQAQSRQLPYQAIKLVIAPADRALLHEKITLRFHAMLEQGLLEEVRRLYQRGDLTENKPAIRAVGYRQVWCHLQGQYDFNTMTEKAIVATRQLAKRQFTWLRRETDALWFYTEKNDIPADVLRKIEVEIIQTDGRKDESTANDSID